MAKAPRKSSGTTGAGAAGERGRTGQSPASTPPGGATPQPVKAEPRAGGARPQSGTSRRPPTREDIERRAYEIYQRRGGQGGRDLDDWLEAERELRREERSA